METNFNDGNSKLRRGKYDSLEERMVKFAKKAREIPISVLNLGFGIYF